MKVRKFVIEIDGVSGEVLSSIELDGLSDTERGEILNRVFEQGLVRLGYKHEN